jgi:GNAT superfamily N-acetyltransferase
MYIQQIDDKDFTSLSQLYYDYTNSVDKGYHPHWYATELLIKDLRKPGALAIGLYVRDKLVGFILGNTHEEYPDVYYFSALYIQPKYRFYVKRLYNAAEDMVRANYKAWETDAINEKAIALHKKMGATPVKITYRKEL